MTTTVQRLKSERKGKLLSTTLQKTTTTNVTLAWDKEKI